MQQDHCFAERIELLSFFPSFQDKPFRFRELWQGQCNLSKDRSIRQNGRIVNVAISIFERLVKQVFYTDRYETVPLGQAITDGGVSEFVITGFDTPCPSLPIKITILINIRRFKADVQPEGVKEVHPQWNPMGFYFLESKIKLFIPI